MVNYIHKKCGGIAFVSDHILAQGEIVNAKNISMPDGKKPDIGSIAKCFSCGGDIKFMPECLEVDVNHSS